MQQLNYKNFKNIIIADNDIGTVDKKELDFIAKEIEELEELTENDNRLSEVVNDLKNIQSNLELSNIDKKCKAILEVYEVKNAVKTIIMAKINKVKNCIVIAYPKSKELVVINPERKI